MSLYPESYLLSAPVEVCIIGQNHLVNLYLSDRVGKDPVLRCVRFEDLMQCSPKPGEPDAPKPETRLAVIGDSDFAANGTLGMPGNRDLFMNTIGWLSQQDNLISIRPKEPDDRRITLTATQESNIFWLSLLIIPGCIFAAGVSSWWRRRG